ncbi:MAG: hypothetical protein ABUL68_02860, partial [Pseudomonadota bacterium]
RLMIAGFTRSSEGREEITGMGWGMIPAAGEIHHLFANFAASRENPISLSRNPSEGVTTKYTKHTKIRATE